VSGVSNDNAHELRLGIVGFGKIARDQHVPALAAVSGITLAATASRHGNAPGIPAYPSIEAMLEAEIELDAVALCQPPQARFAAARTAILAGKHVFLEKPPGATLSEVEALISLAREKNVTLFASWHSREAAAVAAAQAWLADKAIISARVVWKEDVRVWHPGQNWIWEPGGFGVFDPGINALSILTRIMPEPLRVLSAELQIPSNCAAPIAANIVMITASSVPIAAEFDFLQTGPQTWDIVVESEAGELLLQQGGNALTIKGERQPVGEESEYANLYRRFIALIAEGRSEVDLAPLRLVADAFLCGRLTTKVPFEP
jgi:predicted dehydrogenase